MERRATAGVLGMAEGSIRVLSRGVGGVSVKIDTYSETIIAGAMAMRLNRPVS